MLTFLRRVIGLVLVLAGLYLTYRYGVAAYASALADPVPAAVSRPCQPVAVVGVDVQSRCAGTWTRAGGAPANGQVYGVVEADAGGTVDATPYGEYAFAVPAAGTPRTLGLASGAILLIGLVLLLKGRRRAHHRVRRRSRVGGGHGNGDWDDDHDSDSGYDSDSGGGGDGGGGD